MGKIVLYLAGGAMTGVFGAGVLKRLQEIDFYEHLEAVYSVSAGALNGAYFLARQAPLLETIYTKELAVKDFVQTARILTRSEENVIDLDYLFSCVGEKHKLDLEQFQKQPIPLFAKVFNICTDSVEYLDARDYGVFPVLQATSCIVPFYKRPVQINEQSYVDGAIKESIGLARIREKHPDSPIVIVVNAPFRKGLKRLLAKLWRNAVLFAACDKRFYDLFTTSYRLEEEELKEALASQNIFVVYPPLDFPVSHTTTDARALHKGYEAGYRIADYILPYVQKQFMPAEKREFPAVPSVFPQVADAVPA